MMHWFHRLLSICYVALLKTLFPFFWVNIFVLINQNCTLTWFKYILLSRWMLLLQIIILITLWRPFSNQSSKETEKTGLPPLFCSIFSRENSTPSWHFTLIHPKDLNKQNRLHWFVWASEESRRRLGPPLLISIWAFWWFYSHTNI